VNEAKVTQPLFPIGKMTKGIFGGSVMLKNSVLNKSVDQFGKGMDPVMLIELKLAEPDLPLGIGRPIVGFLLSVKVIANSRVTFDAYDDAPDSRAIVIFAFKNRCHNSKLHIKKFGWMACRVKLFFTAPPLHRRRII